MGTVTQKIRVTGALFVGTVAQKMCHRGIVCGNSDTKDMSQGHCLWEQ